jgi:hypothetical protein
MGTFFGADVLMVAYSGTAVRNTARSKTNARVDELQS